uniref:C2H2-type domain-containing protein n=1 Tax=Anopheles christyi TaxID=43041 RepID=A0A182KCI7_9DIPT
MVVPAIRIKSEPLPLDPRGGGFGEYEEQQPLTEENDVQPTAAVAAANTDGGVSSILRSILLQTRDSTTSRSSPNTEPESPRQTPQLPTHPVLSQQEAEEDAEEEKDIKPSLLQQMLLQQQCASSPANRSPAKPSDTNDGGGSLSRDNSTSGASSASTTSSLLKRMLLDGSGSAANATAEQQAPPTSGSPLEGPSGQPSQRNTHLRTKHEPPSATNTPSPPGQRVKDDVPSNETPLASQLRSILLQHRSTTWDGTTRTASMSDASPEQQQQQPEHQVSGEHKTNATSFEKPEVSYVRSLFLRNDSDSESEPPPVEDQREMLLYAMFHELRARQQQQQQQHHHPHQNSQQQQSGFSSESDDDSDDLPQDYRLPSVRRRSTDSVESRTKRRRMEYPCLLCGRTFAGKTKLVLHMRTHMMLDGGGADGSSLSGTASSGGGTASISLPAVSPAIGGALLPNGGGGGGSASDVEDVAGRLLTAPQGQRHEEATFGESVGNEDEIDALERRSYACYICGADQNNFAQDFFCRLCAAEGILIHPLFPPGDNDPKDELVRMIEVLTSVHLAQSDDAGAVICDKCLQLLDLFCKFREECLRQDVLIRTRRTLLVEQLEQQQQQELLVQQQHQQTFFSQQHALSILQPVVEVKVEDADDVADCAQAIAAIEPEEILCTPAQQFAVIADCKEEGEATPIESEPFLVMNEPTGFQCITHDRLLSSSLSVNTCVVPLALSPTGNLSITVPTSATSPDGTEISIEGTTECDADKPFPPRRGKGGKAKPNFKKPPPECELCQQQFTTHYEFQQHMNREHAWDKGNRCSLACDPCQMRFTKSYNLKRHLYEVHGEVPHGLTVIPCEHCGERFLRGNILERHIARVHRNKKQHKVCAIKST